MSPESTHRPHRRGPGRVTRVALARDRFIWTVHGLLYAAVGISTAFLAFVVPEYRLGAMLAFAAVLSVAAILMLATRPPPLETFRSHLSIAGIYSLIGLGELAYLPDWSAALPAAMFVGTMVPLRNARPRHVVAHLSAAAVCLTVPALVAGAGAAALLGLVAVMAAVCVLTFCCAMIFDQVDAQAKLLEERLRQDPLTGVGNQAWLTEQLAAELERHARLRRPLSVIALDLTDFTDLNEALGRTAGDELLIQAGAAITAALSEEALVTRPVDDEFWIVLPGVDALAAQGVIDDLREALARVTTGDGSTPTLSAAIGVGSYPRDGVNDAVLTELARTRRAADAERAQVARPGPALPRAPLPPPAPVVRGLSRRDMAENLTIWRVAAVMTLVLAGFGVATILVSPDADPGRALLFIAVLLFGFALVAGQRPPPANTVRNHAVVANLYVSMAVGFWALQPDPELAIAVGVFVGPTIATRLQSRVAIISHIAAANTLLTVLLVVGVLGDSLTTVTLLQLTLMVPSIWSLGIASMVGLEVAERQGLALERLLRTDQITGVGNRLLLDDLLDREIQRHAAAGLPLSIIVVELLEAYENTQGASEQLLTEAAKALTEGLGPDDIVIRRRGHEFVLVLPDAPPHAVDHTASAVFASLAQLDKSGHRVECVHASASYPQDGANADELLAAADGRLAHAGAPIGFKRPLPGS